MRRRPLPRQQALLAWPHEPLDGCPSDLYSLGLESVQMPTVSAAKTAPMIISIAPIDQLSKPHSKCGSDRSSSGELGARLRERLTLIEASVAVPHGSETEGHGRRELN